MKTALLLFVVLTGLGFNSARAADVLRFYQVSSELYRSGHLDAAGYDEVDKTGIRSVISLEDYSDADAAAEKALADQHHMTFVRVPMSGYDKPTLATIGQVLDQIKALPKPVLVHCMFGRDRTGIIVGAYRITHDGWDAERAIKEMRDLGHLESLYWWDDVLYEVK